jgi:hypothetical protein
LPCTQKERERYPTGPLMTELEFEQAVEAWHVSASNLPVHEFIGLTWEQYASLVEGKKEGRDGPTENTKETT